VWSVLNNEPVLQPPFKITVERPGSLEQGSTDRPSSITVDPTSGLVYIGLKRSQAVGVFHGTTGERVRTLELPARPTKVVVNPIQRLVYAIMPERNSIAILDPNQPTPLIATANAPQATDMVVSEDGRTIYVIHFSGELSTIDARTGELRARVLISQPGLQGLTQGGGLLIATNVALKQLTVWDTTTAQIIQHVGLEQQPSAIAYGPITGTVYVLGFGDPLDAEAPPEPPLLINVSPSTGVVNGFVLLTDRAGQMQQSPAGMPGDDPDLMALNNNIAVNPFTEVVYLVNPEAGQISIAAPCLFPNLAASPAAAGLPAPDFLCRR
jgi:DNA-binding beta-propeller fold protein YncE